MSGRIAAARLLDEARRLLDADHSPAARVAWLPQPAKDDTQPARELVEVAR